MVVVEAAGSSCAATASTSCNVAHVDFSKISTLVKISHGCSSKESPDQSHSTVVTTRKGHLN